MTDDINCTPEQALARLTVCQGCEKFRVVAEGTICFENNCSVAMLTTITFKTCPLSKW